jgi:hypothetical protein
MKIELTCLSLKFHLVNVDTSVRHAFLCVVPSPSILSICSTMFMKQQCLSTSKYFNPKLANIINILKFDKVNKML